MLLFSCARSKLVYERADICIVLCVADVGACSYFRWVARLGMRLLSKINRDFYRAVLATRYELPGERHCACRYWISNQMHPQQVCCGHLTCIYFDVSDNLYLDNTKTSFAVLFTSTVYTTNCIIMAVFGFNLHKKWINKSGLNKIRILNT